MLTKLRYLYRAYRYRYRVDPAELRFVCSHLQPGQVAVDIGCHKGAYTYWMRRRVGPSGSVFAFEPQPRQVAYLRDVFSAMRYDNVSIVPMAVSDSEGELPLHMADSTHAATLEARSMERGAGSTEAVVRGSPDPAQVTTGGLHSRPTERPGVGAVARSGDRPQQSAPCSLLVPVTTLDAFFANRPQGPNFVKIDVEGHELAVLRGARRTLETHRPTILVECEARHRRDGDVRPVFGFLQSLGYEGSFFLNGRRRPLEEFDAAAHQRIDPHSTGLPRGYANNFAFEH